MTNRKRNAFGALIAASVPLALAVAALVFLSTAVQPALARGMDGQSAERLTAGRAITWYVDIPPAIGPQKEKPPADGLVLPEWFPPQRSTISPQSNSELEIILSAASVVTNGDFVTYTLTVINHTASTLVDTFIADVLPKADDKYILSEVQCSPACGRVYETETFRDPLGTLVTVSMTRQVSWTIGSLAGQTQLSFWGRVIGLDDGTSFSNFAQGFNLSVPGASTSNAVQTTVRVPAGANGQVSISDAPTWLSADLGGTMDMDWGDFDHDGDLDLVLGSTIGTTVYRNENGRLQVYWENDRYTLGVRWADFDRDGDLELVAVGESTDNRATSLGYIRLYDQSGTGFIETNTISPTLQLVRAEPGDFDNDGHLDLVVTTNSINPPSCPVLAFRYTVGSGFDDTGGVCISPNAAANISSADYNNDGYLDLVLGEFPNRIRLLTNKGLANQFQFTSTLILPGLSFMPYDFAWGDYDGDGLLDLAAAFPFDRRARIYHNDGGTFSFAQDVRTTLFRTPLGIVWGDVDGDTDLDLVIAGDPPAIYQNIDGVFGSSAPIETSAIRGQVWRMASADHDGDGDLDLVVGNRDGATQLFTVFSAFLSTTLSTVDSAATSGVAWGDYDGDGELDLLFGRRAVSDPTNATLHSNQGAAFTVDSNGIFDDGGFGPRRVSFADVDNDHDLDVVIGTIAMIWIQVNNGGGSWSPHSLVSSSEVRDIAWADADTDGDLDMFVGRNGQNALYINEYIQVGPPPSYQINSTPHWLANADNTTSVAWGDFDNDLYPDIAVGNDGERNRIYRNNQDKTFTLVNWFPTDIGHTQSVAWGDYDGDGDLDLAVGNGQNERNWIYENVNGTFANTPAWQSPEARSTSSLAWGDWNNDGTLDLAVGNRGQPDQVYANESGTLRLAWVSAESFQTTQVAWGDQDRDGDLDLAISQDGGGRSGVYENSYAYPSHLHQGTGPLTNNPSYAYVERPGQTKDAYFYSSAEVLARPASPTVTVDYIVYDAEQDPISNTLYEYSLDGGGTWHTATPAQVPTFKSTGTLSTGLPLAFLWDAVADDAIGDNARFRVTIYHNPPVGPVQRAFSRAVSPPFRLEATDCTWPEQPAISFSPAHPDPGQWVQFVGSIRPGTGSHQITYSWDFGDGQTLDGQEVYHRYNSDGVYDVRLEVTSSPCPITKTLAVIQSITVGSGVPNIYLPLVLKDANSSASGSGQ
jgi:uncharacterized repeat protein (TIGR01451 family)